MAFTASLSALKSGMPFGADQLNDIYDRTSGYCHLCHRQLAFVNYGAFGRRGAWEVEHSKPQCQGGGNRQSNLYAACITCNRSKGARSTRMVRSQCGVKRAPMSVKKRQEAKNERAATGALIGASLMGALLGPWGGVAGLFAGVYLGGQGNPDRW